MSASASADTVSNASEIVAKAFVSNVIGNAAGFMKTLVVVGGAIGVCRGAMDWLNWLQSYKTIVMPPSLDFLVPILNCSVMAGKLAWNVCYYGGASAVVTATFPVSVPLLLQFQVADKK